MNLLHYNETIINTSWLFIRPIRFQDLNSLVIPTKFIRKVRFGFLHFFELEIVQMESSRFISII